MTHEHVESSPIHPSPSGSTSGETPNRVLLRDAMQALFRDRDAAAIRALFRGDYIQHNPTVPTGLDALLGMLPFLDSLGLEHTVHRVLEDDNLLLTHTTYRNADPSGATLIAFDLWRIEGGKVAEHWDGLSPVSGSPGQGVGGATVIEDRDQTAANKAVVHAFVTAVIHGEASAAGHVSANAVTHEGGQAGAEHVSLLAGMSRLDIQRIHRVVGEGNFALTQSEGTLNGLPHAFYDLFRLSSGKIVEHWAIRQPIPAESANTNTMF